MRKLIYILILFVSSCGVSKHLVYIDDWEGKYHLIEINSCCEVITKWRLDVVKNSADNYSWKLFFEGQASDTTRGVALYQKNKLKFYVDVPEIASKYFEGGVEKQNPVFWMEYDNYYSDSSFRHVGYYTRWNRELKGYEASHHFASGVDYHFRISGKEKIMLRKN